VGEVLGDRQLERADRIQYLLGLTPMRSDVN
jgi:hypothetical protein